jgi:hypothetical protein
MNVLIYKSALFSFLRCPMKAIFKKIKSIYQSGDNPFYFSLFGPLFMGTIHLIATILHFDWIILNYCIFSYLLALFLVWQWAIEKYNLSIKHYISGIISIFLILGPMMASFVLTILYRDTPHYIFEYFIYAYALYGTIKMVLSIRKLLKENKTNKEIVLSYFGLISALYTIQMMEFHLIMAYSTADEANSMYMMQLFSQGAIFIISLILISILIVKSIKYKKNE